MDARKAAVDDAPVGLPNKPPAQDEEAKRESGIREQETVPAPAGSTRPTTIPDYDFAAVASSASMRHATLKNIALDITIPIPLATEVPADLDLRLAFLLLHADGQASIGQIALAVERPPHDVLASFVELASLGLVRLQVPR